MLPYINFQKLNQSLCPEAVVLSIDPSAEFQISSQIRTKCTIHHSDNQSSLVIDPNTNKFFCHACEAKGDLIQLFALSLKITSQEAAYILVNQNNLPQKTDIETKNTNIVKKSLDESLKSAYQAWEEVKEGHGHSYFKTKMIEPCPGLRYGPDQMGNHSIVVPFYSLKTDKLQTVQYVHEKGKYFLKGSDVKGAAFIIGCISEARTIYIAEGLATTITIWQGMNKVGAFISCGPSNSIADTVIILRSKYPTKEIIACLDSDIAGEMVERSLKRVKQIIICKPNFEGLNYIGREKLKDFNDLISKCNQPIKLIKQQIKDSTCKKQINFR